MTKYQFSVDVQSTLEAAASAPQEDAYAFSYTVTIRNIGDIAAQLIARHWVVQDSGGLTREVRGLGVVGQQPLLRPGEAFRYTSGCHLHTASGTMHGSYFCVAEDGEQFDVPIPPFSLGAGAVTPAVLH
ncbi:MAG: Co2+/Mg2+ efflux protein ApaG [Ottowia sp.]|nr:Co2+/Mg2+ efflux protein ApaG [Ottowia sp.]